MNKCIVLNGSEYKVERETIRTQGELARNFCGKEHTLQQFVLSTQSTHKESTIQF